MHNVSIHLLSRAAARGRYCVVGKRNCLTREDRYGIHKVGTLLPRELCLSLHVDAVRRPDRRYGDQKYRRRQSLAGSLLGTARAVKPH